MELITGLPSGAVAMGEMFVQYPKVIEGKEGATQQMIGKGIVAGVKLYPMVGYLSDLLLDRIMELGTLDGEDFLNFIPTGSSKGMRKRLRDRRKRGKRDHTKKSKDRYNERDHFADEDKKPNKH